jgi:hypothetical protein
MLTKVINLWAGPGAGKSTIAAQTFAEFKWMGYKAELVVEYAKELHYDGDFERQKDQMHLLAVQAWRQTRLLKEVEYIITDSPLPLGIVYNKLNGGNEDLDVLCLTAFNEFDNINFFLQRTKPYQTYGRTQSESGARDIDSRVKELLRNESIPFIEIRADRVAARHIYETVINQ